MQLFIAKISRAAASQLINTCMLRRYLVTDHSQLDRILAWVADPDHRCRLIGSGVADVMEYHVILDLSYGHVDLIDLIAAEFPEALQAVDFPRSHP